MSVRDQERRQRQAKRRIDAAMRRAEKEVKGGIRARQQEAMRRADEVVRRIEVGDVQPRPLPGMREDSEESMGSMESTGSMGSSESMEEAETVSGVTGEAEPEDMQENMPLQEEMPYDPESAHDDLAQRVTEETGSGGDPHEHADRKVEQMGDQMFEE